jgi:hypothetical protein
VRATFLFSMLHSCLGSQNSNSSELDIHALVGQPWYLHMSASDKKIPLYLYETLYQLLLPPIKNTNVLQLIAQSNQSLTLPCIGFMCMVSIKLRGIPSDTPEVSAYEHTC